ncbi:MAG: hypothetical protein ACFCU1_01465 [Sumerlaeia bacterium]
MKFKTILPEIYHSKPIQKPQFTGFAAVAALLAIIASPLYSQTITVSTPDQVLNGYTSLANNASAGSLSFNVNDVSTLGTVQRGTRLLIYQNKGASASGTNGVAYGEVSNFQNSGRYEIVEVYSVIDRPAPQSDIINLESVCGGLVNSYTSSQNAQVISLPAADQINITSTGSVTALPYNGSVGGIIALLAETSITIDGQIVATGLGFRGGATDNNSESLATVRTDYRASQSARGANKGESIVLSPGTGNFQRGAIAQSGGGGNTNNAGGGGGANGTNGNTWTGQGVMAGFPTAWALDPGFIANGNTLTTSSGGGRGGYTTSANAENPSLIAPGNALWGGNNRRELGGLGGRPMPNNPEDRVFLGGAGGAGDGNNNAAGAGGNGGGLVLLIAPTVTGIGSVVSNGLAGGNATGQDAAGGGGGGGTIIVDSITLSNTLSFTARGGNGGSQIIPVPGNEAQGPGGGGGGGYIHYNGGTPIVNVTGGTAGTTNALSMALFPPNGATNGSAGGFSNTAFTVPACSTRPVVGYGLVQGRVFDDLDGNGELDSPGELGLDGITFFFTENGGQEEQGITQADGTFSRTVLAPGNTTIEIEANQPRVWPRTQNTTSNLVQVVSAVLNSAVTASNVGFREPTDLCVIDWSATYDPTDFFGGYPSTGPSSPTQDGRIPLNYAEIPVGTGSVTFFLKGEHMLDGDQDGLAELPALVQGAVFGFGNPIPTHIFYRKSFNSLIVNSGPTDGIDPIDQLDIQYYFPYTNGASNVRFLVYDIDNAGQWTDQIIVTGIGIDGSPVTPTLTALRGAASISVAGSTATGVNGASDTALSLTLSGAGNLLVDFGSTPIRSMGILYENTRFNPSGNQGIGFSQVMFNGCDEAPGRVSGNVFRDDNGNGTQDVGEPNLGDVTVNIILDNGISYEIKTRADGTYAVDVPAGNGIELVVDSADPDLPQPSVNTTSNATQVVNVLANTTTVSNPVGYQPGGPLPTIDINASRSTVGSLTFYQYTVDWGNNREVDPINIANNPVVTITLPNNVTYLSGGISPGFTGSISHNNGVVTFTLDQPIQPGGSGSGFINVRTANPVGVGTITVPAVLQVQDYLFQDALPVDDSADVVAENDVLAVVLIDFSVHHTGVGSLPVVTWETAAEMGTAGFDVYRLQPGIKEKSIVGATKINSQFIDPQGSPLFGATYQVVDPLPLEKGEQRFYVLKETEFSGAEILYGPEKTLLNDLEPNTNINDWLGYE